MNLNRIIITLAIMIFSYTLLSADQRSYVWTYEYMIMEPGKAELEQYTTFSSTDIDEFEGNTSTELNLELEFGMNKFFDFAIYQNFGQGPEGGFQYKGFKLRSRFKIGEKGQLPMDPLIYVEYKGKPDFSEHKFETKFILAKDIGNFNIALNPYFELEYEDEWEFEPKYALGVSYKLGKLFTFGAEAKGGESGNYIGPSIAHGSHKMWMALGSLFKVGDVDDGKPEYYLRMILGIEI